MEKFTRIISIDGNYAYNTIGETFYVTDDLLPMSTPCVISYNPEWTSSINRIAIDDEGEELYYTVNVRHVKRVFNTTEELVQYRREQWDRELIIVDYYTVTPSTDIAELIAL